MALTLIQLQTEIAELRQKCTQLEARQEWVERLFGAYGVRGPWLSPAQAAPLLGISKDRIEGEIRRAEHSRALRNKTDFKYGTHYRDIRDSDSERGSWQVHVGNVDKYFSIPPSQRKA